MLERKRAVRLALLNCIFVFNSFFNIIVELSISYIIFFVYIGRTEKLYFLSIFQFFYISARLTFNFEKTNYLFSWDRFLKTYDVNNSKLRDKLRIYEIDQCVLWMIYMLNRCLKMLKNMLNGVKKKKMVVEIGLFFYI